MGLEIYDTTTRTRRAFKPIDPKNVRMYVCGSTVYDLAHIGNARPVIVFDVLFRLLRHVYGENHVKYVRNITDIDDKINKRAHERGITIRELTDKTAAIYAADMKGLGNLVPTAEPRATETIPEIVTMISKLIDKGFAYAADGHVLFNVPAMSDYGKFSGRATDELIAGARVDVAPYKKSPMDFVLWKPSDDPILPGWESPWGRGRPGWHIECSAMAEKLLGDTFDIHGGGRDLIFPHHENEVAQSTCAHGGEPLANFWMHNAMLELRGEKMAKSVGNVFTAHALLGLWPGDVLRLQMLSTHYRHPIEWMESKTKESKIIMDRWYGWLEERNLDPVMSASTPNTDIVDALCDDLNTPKAIYKLHDLFEQARANKIDPEGFIGSAKFLGFLSERPEQYFSRQSRHPLIEAERDDKIEINALLDQRNKARSSRDYVRSDYFRNLLLLRGLKIEDDASGTSLLKRYHVDYLDLSEDLREALKDLVIHARETYNDEEGHFGFIGALGYHFSYTERFYRQLYDFYLKLEESVGLGVVTHQKLLRAIAEIVISARLSDQDYPPESLVNGVLIKLFSEEVESLRVLIKNDVAEINGSTSSLRIGDVEINSDAEEYRNRIGAYSQQWFELLRLDRNAKSVFSIRMIAQKEGAAHRAAVLARAFVSSIRLMLIYAGKPSKVGFPSRGMEEPSLGDHDDNFSYLIINDEGSSTTGWRRKDPYLLDHHDLSVIERSPLLPLFDQILSSVGMQPFSPEIIALDRMARGRASSDPTAKAAWFIASIGAWLRAFSKTELGWNESIGLLEAKLSTPKAKFRQLKQDIAYLSRLRQQFGVVGYKEAERAQDVAERLVLESIFQLGKDFP